MGRSSLLVGVVLLAVLGLLDCFSPLLFGGPEGAPAAANTISVVLGVVTLVALVVWAVPSQRASAGGRAGMWIAVVVRALSALLGLLGLTDSGTPVGLKITIVVFFVLTVVGIVLVRPALGRRGAADSRLTSA